MRVEVRGLSKRFGRVTALHDVGFALPAGCRAALIGPNGSGKSTLNRVLMGLLRYEGEVLLDGRAPDRERVDVARHCAYVPQAPPALAVPVGELERELARVRGIAPERIEALAERLDLPLRELRTRPFRGLSGGMKQKLMIALALAADASLLILDEPTGSLDAQSRERFFQLFDELPEETTLLLCSHRLDEVRQLVEHVLVLDEGRLVYDGAASAFLDRSATGVIEARVEGDRAEAWLAEHGFSRGASGWWTRTVGRSEKRELLAKLSNELGSALRDLNARDLEWIELRETKEPDDERG